jgi:hypothetical protein
MKNLIISNHTKLALVDDEDYEHLTQYNWSITGTFKGRVGRNYRVDGRTIHVSLGQEILNTKQMVDHINRNPLDNRRCNLRIATRQQNAMNRNKRIDSASKYKGVSPNKTSWVARIFFDSRRIYLGSFTSEIEAAQAYDVKARELFGEFAKTNF